MAGEAFVDVFAVSRVLSRFVIEAKQGEGGE